MMEVINIHTFVALLGEKLSHSESFSADKAEARAEPESIFTNFFPSTILKGTRQELWLTLKRRKEREGKATTELFDHD